MADELLTSAQAAEVLNVDPQTVRRWLRSGRLRAIRREGGHYRIRRSDLSDVTPAPVGAGQVEQLRKVVRDQRREVTAAQDKIAKAAAERDRIDQRREVLVAQVEGLQARRFGADGEPREKVEASIAKVAADLSQLEESGRGIGATYREFSRLEAGLRDSDQREDWAKLRLARERLARWLGNSEAEASEHALLDSTADSKGTGAMVALADELAAAQEALAEAVNELAAALRENLEVEAAKLERQVAELEEKLTPLQQDYPAQAGTAQAHADELLKWGRK